MNIEDRDDLELNLENIVFHLQEAGMDVHMCEPGEPPGLYDEDGEAFLFPPFEDFFGYEFPQDYVILN